MFQFLLGLTRVPRENKNNAYAKFWRTNKEYYGILESGQKTPTLPAAHKHLKVINTTNMVIRYIYDPCDNDWLLVLRSLSVAKKSVIPLTPFVAPFPPPIDGFHSRELTAILVYKTIENICVEFA